MRKTLVKLPCLLLLILLVACQQSHFISDESYRAVVVEDYLSKARIMHRCGLNDSLNVLRLSTEEKEAMQFLYAYMPSADVVDYSASFFLENVRATLQAREEMSWGPSIPEQLLRHFVLPVRVNNENLDHSRMLFYEELKPRVQHLSLKEAILEINHWCHEKVSYQPSDARTSSPLATIKTAYGRCGEESTFTVSALRAMGIPARQVYTPRWAHTDNNHAWVEAWAEGEWHFLGACEPEPVLNLGWFNAPASRGMLMHTKVFGKYVGPEELMSQTANYTEINVIGNYAPTARVNVFVKDELGQAVSGAKVAFKIYNYAEFYTVAQKFTDRNGQTFLTAGKGDMLVWASKGGKFGFKKCSFGQDEELSLVLDQDGAKSYSLDLDFVPPVEQVNTPTVTLEQREQNDERLAQEDSIRKAYVDTFITEQEANAYAKKWSLESSRVASVLLKSRGNYPHILEFLSNAAEKEQADLALELLGVISDKDLRDVSVPVLEDHLYHSLALAGAENDFAHYVLNPRVENELLSPYKAFFQDQIDGDLAEIYRQNPLELARWCTEELMVMDEINAQQIRMSPVGVWKSRTPDALSRDIFFVAVARSLGIPAWKSSVTGKVQYRSLVDHETYDVDFEGLEVKQASQARLIATYSPTTYLDDPKYYTHFTLSKLGRGTYQVLSFDEGSADMGQGLTWSKLLKDGISLDTGHYMLTTGTRMASGTVLSHISFFSVRAGETNKIELVMRESKDQVQVIGEFNSENRYLPLNQKEDTSILQTTGRGYYLLGVLGVGQEPTNHALRDLIAVKDDLEKWGRSIVLLFPDGDKARLFRSNNDFQNLPTTVSFGTDTTASIQNEIRQNMKLKSDRLPIFIVADTFNRVVFVSQGYTIGLGEQLLELIHGLD